MPKMKTSRAAAKRYKVTGTGIKSKASCHSFSTKTIIHGQAISVTLNATLAAQCPINTFTQSNGGIFNSMMWFLKLLPTLKSILTRIPFLPLLLMQTVVRLLNKQM